MPWLELNVETSASTAQHVADALSAAGALSVTFRDSHDEPLYEPALGTEPLWQHSRLIGLFETTANVDEILADLTRRFGAEKIRDARISVLEDQPWERAWMDHFAPMRFGARLWICPTWCEPPDSNAVNIIMDPGLAFGTGTHATTALCLEWLDAHPPLGHAVIDYGCGSGVLSIAAAKLGARRVIAIDHDAQALLATKENAVRNGVANILEIASPEKMPAITADVLVANILANPLCELAPRFAMLVRSGGMIALSGILRDQAAGVAAAYHPWFAINAPTLREDWVRLDGTRY